MRFKVKWYNRITWLKRFMLWCYTVIQRIKGNVSPYGMVWGGMAITRRDWAFIKDIIIDLPQPVKVLEFGCGLSSLLIADYAQVVSYETDEKYKKVIDSHNHCDLEIRLWDGKHIDEDLTYIRRKWRKATLIEKFDLCFINGAQGIESGGCGREHSFRIASEVCDRIIVHDASRTEEWYWQLVYLSPYFTEGSYSDIQACNYWVRRNKPKIRRIV